eukprot:CAMPEP_0179410628 /NCGR_PEP_ID=MMETSP0799-20121207/3415_1 /TAXON_ID=46947 /ORGANISM="Geminigera cryophila, Strain CCMP2564" /LENGTH=139 /DNA_ID=CAMNT_0021182543 /DNA_START=86 /DNA_END=505 /DNA_ORIENTATION=-
MIGLSSCSAPRFWLLLVATGGSPMDSEASSGESQDSPVLCRRATECRGVGVLQCAEPTSTGLAVSDVLAEAPDENSSAFRHYRPHRCRRCHVASAEPIAVGAVSLEEVCAGGEGAISPKASMGNGVGVCVRRRRNAASI